MQQTIEADRINAVMHTVVKVADDAIEAVALLSAVLLEIHQRYYGCSVEEFAAEIERMMVSAHKQRAESAPAN